MKAEPSAPRDVGPRHYTLSTELGAVIIAATDEAVTGVWFAEQKHAPTADLIEDPEHPLCASMAKQLREYLAGQRRSFTVPTATVGTAFQRRVWELLADVPYGEVTSYSALAQELGQPAAVRAVGQAVGRNPLSIVVPCHRVVRADRSLGGYAGGLWRKELLLQLETAPTNTP